MSKRLLTLLIRPRRASPGSSARTWWCPGRNRSRPPNARPQLIKADKDKLVKIILSDRHGRHADAGEERKDVDGGFPRQFALDESNVDDLALTFTSLTAERVIDEKPTDLAQYGLAPPRAQGMRPSATARQRPSSWGTRLRRATRYYLQVKGDPKVYTVWQNHGDQMHWTLADLRDKKISPEINYDQVTYFRLTRADGSEIELKEKTAAETKTFQLGFGRYLMTRPYAGPRAAWTGRRGNSFIKGPQQVQISSFVNDCSPGPLTVRACPARGTKWWSVTSRTRLTSSSARRTARTRRIS